MALFLSGYVIQQRTLRDLREAIKPRERVVIKPHLPSHFRPRFNERADGSVEYRESAAEEEAREMRKFIEVRESTAGNVNEGDAKGETKSKASWKQLDILRQVQQSVAENTWSVENPDPLSKNKLPITAAQRRRMIKEELKRLSHNKEPLIYQRRLW